MGIIEVVIFCIVAFTSGNVTISPTTNNTTETTVTTYNEVQALDVVEAAPVEIVIEMPVSYFELAMQNQKLGIVIKKLTEERDRCTDREF